MINLKSFFRNSLIYPCVYVHIRHFSHFAQNVNTSGKDKTVINFNIYSRSIMRTIYARSTEKILFATGLVGS